MMPFVGDGRILAPLQNMTRKLIGTTKCGLSFMDKSKVDYCFEARF
jgi:hypothetical protein